MRSINISMFLEPVTEISLGESVGREDKAEPQDSWHCWVRRSQPYCLRRSAIEVGEKPG